MDAIKTKDFRAFLDAVKCDGKAVVITPEMRETVIKSARNLPGVMTTTAKILSVYDILNAKYLVIDQSALAIIEEVFCVMTAYDIIIRPIITERSNSRALRRSMSLRWLLLPARLRSRRPSRRSSA